MKKILSNQEDFEKADKAQREYEEGLRNYGIAPDSFAHPHQPKIFTLVGLTLFCTYEDKGKKVTVEAATFKTKAFALMACQALNRKQKELAEESDMPFDDEPTGHTGADYDE